MTEKPVVMQTSPIVAPMDHIYERYTVLRLDQAADKDGFLAANGPGVRAAIGNKITAETMASLPDLALYANFGVGYDGVDIAGAKANGVRVTNTPDVLTEEVADTTMALLLAGLRQIPQVDRYVRDGRWEREGPYPLLPVTLVGATVGILGLGRIGAAIAKRCVASGALIAYTGRAEKAGFPTYGFVADLEDLASRSDILVVACKGGEETRNLVTREVLRALGPKGLLVNIARGSVVDEPALAAALEEGEIWGAALDVFDKEPFVPEALKHMTDRVVLAPHIGSATEATRTGMANVMIANVEAFFAGKPLLTEVPETKDA
ncbi:MAG: 2-hydroxyacid dehydrogenase [Alphaproteobacteria bacterium]|nr:2-hydroxyacid dehydrogenase [Alphaproteobacteria bacterium]